MLRLALQGLALGGMAWASLRLALVVAEARFVSRVGSPSDGSLARGIVPGLVVCAGLWLYGHSDRVAAAVWRAAHRRRAI